jgi:hypothetical protein
LSSAHRSVSIPRPASPIKSVKFKVKSSKCKAKEHKIKSGKRESEIIHNGTIVTFKGRAGQGRGILIPLL